MINYSIDELVQCVSDRIYTFNEIDEIFIYYYYIYINTGENSGELVFPIMTRKYELIQGVYVPVFPHPRLELFAV